MLSAFFWFSWGERSQQRFWTKDGHKSHGTRTQHGVQLWEPGYRIRDLRGGPQLLAFIRTDGKAFIVPGGPAGRGRLKFLRDRIRALSCRDDEATLLEEGGGLLRVELKHTPPSARPLPGFSDLLVSQVSCGSHHSLALTRDGRLFSWGLDSRGQLGLGGSVSGSGSGSGSGPGAGSPQLVSVMSALPLVRIAAGGEQSFAVSVSGGVFSWGANDRGQLGLGDVADRKTPSSVRCLNGKKSTDVSCGRDHTAVLTKDGAVFTFGCGRHGQLGHNSYRDELRPRLVAELWGSKVVAVACGSHHTLVLTRSGSVFSFGLGEHGQLGREAENPPAVPLPVQLPPGRGIGNIFAAGNCSFASSDEDVPGDPDGGTQLCLEDAIESWSSECDSKAWRKIQKNLKQTFSSAACWNRSFLQRSGDKHFRTSPEFHGMNLPAARRAFEQLLEPERAAAKVEEAVLLMLGSLDPRPPGVEALRVYLLLLELLLVLQRTGRRQNSRLAEALAAAIVSLSRENLQVIASWWCSLPRSASLSYVTVWNQTLSLMLGSAPVPRGAGVKNLLVVLQLLYDANGRVPESRRLPDSRFCLRMTDGFLQEELLLWRNVRPGASLLPGFQPDGSEPLVLGRFPFLMDLRTKKLVFDATAKAAKVTEMYQMAPPPLWFSPWFSMAPDVIYFVLKLNRESVLDDTFQQLAEARDGDFRRPLGVWFDGAWHSDPLYSVFLKDFFYKAFHEAFSPESGLFMFNDSETLAWFSSRTPGAPERFFLLGVLCGLALYNGYIIYFPVPLVLFKKLLGVEPALEDMLEFQPCLGRCLRSILYEYSDDVLEDLCLDFSVNWDGTDVDLDPQNPGKPVTGQNKKEYVDAYVDHAFNASVAGAFREFRRGFFQVCERDVVKLFGPEQLQEVLVGQYFQDWDSLRQNTEYEDGYHDDHPNIQMFWEVFEELTEAEKKLFLWFVTGFERLPSLNVGRMRMRITVKPVPERGRDQFYPEAHTCWSRLLLPLYSSKDVLKVKLREALDNSGRIYR